MAADPQRALRLMGLCRRAGSLVIGMGALKAALQRGDVRLLVLAGDAAPGSVRRARTAAESAGIPAVVLSDRGSLGSALGREWVAVCGVTDADFADGIRKALESPAHEQGSEAG